MDIVLEIHSRLGNTAMYYAAIMTLWGIWRVARKQGVEGNFRSALVIAGILLVVQGLLGSTLYFFSEFKLARPIHVLYGAVSALVVPAVYAYTRGKEERRDMMILTVALMVLVVLTIRSLGTAGLLLVFE